MASNTKTKPLAARHLATLALVFAWSCAGASVFVCKDKDSKTIMQDGLPSVDCVSEICELRDGIKRCQGPDPSTKDKGGSTEEAQQERDRKTQEQRRGDIALLKMYRNETEIESDRTRDLDRSNEQVKDAQNRLVELQNKEKKLTKEQESYGNRELPKELKQRIANNQEFQDRQRQVIKDQAAEIESTNKHFDEIVKRFRKLKKTSEKSGKPISTNPSE